MRQAYRKATHSHGRNDRSTVKRINGRDPLKLMFGIKHKNKYFMCDIMLYIMDKTPIYIIQIADILIKKSTLMVMLRL